MNNHHLADPQASTCKSILTLSASRHLTGVPVDNVIKADWQKDKAHGIRDAFDNFGFDVDPDDAPHTLEALRNKLQEKTWDGIIIGWCLRGHVEFTLLFEEIVTLCNDVHRVAPHTKIIFNTGQDNIVEAVSRNFAKDLCI